MWNFLRRIWYCRIRRPPVLFLEYTPPTDAPPPTAQFTFTCLECSGRANGSTWGDGGVWMECDHCGAGKYIVDNDINWRHPDTRPDQLQDWWFVL